MYAVADVYNTVIFSIVFLLRFTLFNWVFCKILLKMSQFKKIKFLNYDAKDKVAFAKYVIYFCFEFNVYIFEFPYNTQQSTFYIFSELG